MCPWRILCSRMITCRNLCRDPSGWINHRDGFIVTWQILGHADRNPETSREKDLCIFYRLCLNSRAEDLYRGGQWIDRQARKLCYGSCQKFKRIGGISWKIKEETWRWERAWCWSCWWLARPVSTMCRVYSLPTVVLNCPRQLYVRGKIIRKPKTNIEFVDRAKVTCAMWTFQHNRSFWSLSLCVRVNAKWMNEWKTVIEQETNGSIALAMSFTKTWWTSFSFPPDSGTEDFILGDGRGGE